MTTTTALTMAGASSLLGALFGYLWGNRMAAKGTGTWNRKTHLVVPVPSALSRGPNKSEYTAELHVNRRIENKRLKGLQAAIERGAPNDRKIVAEFIRKCIPGDPHLASIAAEYEGSGDLKGWRIRAFRDKKASGRRAYFEIHCERGLNVSATVFHDVEDYLDGNSGNARGRRTLSGAFDPPADFPVQRAILGF